MNFIKTAVDNFQYSNYETTPNASSLHFVIASKKKTIPIGQQILPKPPMFFVKTVKSQI